MTIATIVGGVDASSEGVWGGMVASRLAGRVSARCQLLHAAFDTTAIAMLPPTVDFDEYIERLTDLARDDVTEALRGHVPDGVLDGLDVRVGRPEYVLREAVEREPDPLIVLGGRRRSATSRFLEGSVTKHLVRTAHVPVLAAVPPHIDYERVLVALDGSDATARTFEWARIMAETYGAALRIIHAVEPLPYDYAGMIEQPEAHVEWVREQFEATLAQLPGGAGTDHVTLRGEAGRTIAREVRRWNADLLIVGSHGKGLVDRILLGSTTSQLINQLPTSLMVIPPVAPPDDERTDEP